MCAPRSLLCTVAAALLGPMDVGAQFTAVHAGVARVDTGARVRVTVAGTVAQSPFGPRVHQIRGTLRALSPDTLYLELPNIVGRVAIPRRSVRGVEVSLGLLSRRKSALASGVVGAVIYALATGVAPGDREGGESLATRRLAASIAIGFGVGAWVGSKRSSERWRAAQLPR